MSTEVKAFAPATVANLAAGFDVLGLAIDGPGDTVTARRAAGSGVRIVEIRGDGGVLPREATANTAGIAAIATLRLAGIDVGVELIVDKGLPIGSGLGSSAASACAAAFAVNRLVGSPLRKPQLIAACLEAEAAVSGRHADNIAPALLGGLVLVRSVDPLDVVRLPVPEGLTVVVVTPAFELETKKARAALPSAFPLATLVRQQANLAGFVAACFSSDLDLLGRCLVDEIAEPSRAPLIPGCAAVIRAAVAAGAIGSSISGAGPSIFALCGNPRSARQAAAAMLAAFSEVGLSSTVVISPADCPGARTP